MALSMRPLIATTVALAAVHLGVVLAQETDAVTWNSNYATFVAEFNRCVKEKQAACPSEFKEKAVAWEGTVASVDKKKRTVSLNMSPVDAPLIDAEGRSGVFRCCTLDMKDPVALKALRAGDKVRFRAVLEGVLMLNIGGFKGIVVLHDPELLTGVQ